MLELEKRKEASRAMVYLTPLIAVGLTMAIGALVFSALGYDGPAAVWEMFVEPLIDPGKWQDLGLKAAPLVMIAVGLSIGFRPTSGTSAPRGSTWSAGSPAPGWRSPPGTSRAAGGCCRSCASPARWPGRPMRRSRRSCGRG